MLSPSPRNPLAYLYSRKQDEVYNQQAGQPPLAQFPSIPNGHHADLYTLSVSCRAHVRKGIWLCFVRSVGTSDSDEEETEWPATESVLRSRHLAVIGPFTKNGVIANFDEFERSGRPRLPITRTNDGRCRRSGSTLRRPHGAIEVDGSYGAVCEKAIAHRPSSTSATSLGRPFRSCLENNKIGRAHV